MEKRTEIINLLIDKFKLDKYLEIGVRVTSQNFDKINTKNKVGVDPKPMQGDVKYVMTSDEYFEKHVNNEDFDIIFVDGLHVYEQAYRDVLNSIKHLNEGGFIVMHDCNPPTEYHIRSYEEYLNGGGQWNGTVFKSFIRLKSELKDWNCFVVNEDFGCGIITKNKLNKQFKSTNIDNYDIDWDFFNNNRNDLLDLISFDNFIKIIG